MAVTTQKLTAVFLPEDGAKLVSLKRADGKELLVTKPGQKYGVLTADGSYVDSECSGFDDMFPTVDPDRPDTAYPAYPDHGECCRLCYTAELTQTALTLRAESRLFPVTYEKTVSVTEDGGILLHYCIANRSEREFPFLWAGHIMLSGEPGMRVLTPFGPETEREMMFVDPATNTGKELPVDRLLTHVPGEGTAYKFYYLAPMPRGEFGVSYADSTALIFSVDPKKLPYLGIWLNNGAFQGGYSITPEPCTAPFDAPTRGASRGCSCQIPAKSEFTFDMQIQLKEDFPCVR